MRHKGLSAVGVLVSSAVVGRLGLDASRELAHFGFTMSGLRSSLAGLPPFFEEQWYRHIGAKLGDQAVALHLGEHMLLADMGLFGFFLQSQPTVGDALRAITAFTPKINGPRIHLLERGGAARAEFHPLSPLVWPVPVAEFCVRMYTAVLSQIVAARVVPFEVQLRHAQPVYAAECERSFGAPVRYGQPTDAVVFAARLLRQPLQGANAALSRALGGALDALAIPPSHFGWSDQVRHALSLLVPDGECSLPVVARTFDLPPHVLKYHLAKEGTTFRNLLDEFRRDLVLHRLLGLPGMTVERMAIELGYQDPRQFYRRFKQWTGTTRSKFGEGTGSPRAPR